MRKDGRAYGVYYHERHPVLTSVVAVVMIVVVGWVFAGAPAFWTWF